MSDLVELKPNVRGICEKKNKPGVYVIRYTDADGRQRKETAGTFSMARQLLAKRHTETLQRVKLPETMRRRTVPFAELCEDARAAVIAKHAALKDSGPESDTNRIDRLEREFGTFAAESIKISQLRHFFDNATREKTYRNGKREKTDKKLSPASLNRLRTVLFSIYRLGIEKEKVTVNPARGLGSKALLKAKKEPKGRVRYLNQFPPAIGQDDEETRLRKVIAADYPTHIDELEIALNTGLRRREMYLHIDWKCVNFERQSLSVPTSKTNEGRDIPLTTAARNAFARLYARSGGKEPIFPGKGKKRLQGARHWFDDAIKKAGIEGFVWHDLRHTFASRAIMAGVDVVTVQRLMGHADLRMTIKYVHLTPVHLRTAIAKLDSFSYTSPAVAQSNSGPFSESIGPSSGQDETLTKVATNVIN